jgi:hypothetical protein
MDYKNNISFTQSIPFRFWHFFQYLNYNSINNNINNNNNKINCNKLKTN